MNMMLVTASEQSGKTDHADRLSVRRAIDKICHAIEDHGGVVVCYDTCGGTRSSGLLVDEEADDIIHAMAERYMKVGCSVLTPNQTRLDNLPDLMAEYRIGRRCRSDSSGMSHIQCGISSNQKNCRERGYTIYLFRN